MTTPDRSGNPDAMRRDAGLVHDGTVAPSSTGPVLSRQFLTSLRQPKALFEKDPRFASRSSSQAQQPNPGVDWKVWASSWTDNGVLGGVVSGVPISDVVPQIVVAPQTVIRTPGPGVALSGADLSQLQASILAKPEGRRALRPLHWMYESPANEELNLTNYYAATSDGSTYTGGVTGYQDPSPLRFTTPWAYINAAHCAASISGTLSALESSGVKFDFVTDDWEAWTGLGLSSPYNTYDGAFDVNGLPLNWATNPNTNWRTIPDPRRTGTIVADSRFELEPVYDGKPMGQLVFENYQAIQAQFGNVIATPGDKVAAARALMAQYTNVANRQNFKSPWGIGTSEALAVWHAFDSAWETVHNEKHQKVKWASLSQRTGSKGQPVEYFNYDSFTLTTVEGRYLFEANGHYYGPKTSMSMAGAAPVLYGELSSGYHAAYGYTPSPATDVQRYAWAYGGTQVASIPYMAFIMNMVKLRATLRSSPEVWQALAPWVCSPVPANSFSRYVDDPRYFHEICHHSLLAGAKLLQYFNSVNDEHHVQKAMNEWSSVSGDKRVRPCSNAEGNPSSPVDKLVLASAARMVVSGAAVVGSSVPKYIWRITVAPNVVSLTRTDSSQGDLPETIQTPSGGNDNDRGVWLVRTTPGMPAYSANIS
jgi:hypothetical protein